MNSDNIIVVIINSSDILSSWINKINRRKAELFKLVLTSIWFLKVHSRNILNCTILISVNKRGIHLVVDALLFTMCAVVESEERYGEPYKYLASKGLALLYRPATFRISFSSFCQFVASLQDISFVLTRPFSSISLEIICYKFKITRNISRILLLIQ